MQFDAVVFDFFGTLTYPVTQEIQDRAVAPLAEIMNAPLDRVLTALADSFADRCRGKWGPYEDAMRRLAVEVGASLSDAELAELCRVRLRMQRTFLMRVRADAEPVVRTLRESGVELGLLSDCTHELPMTWIELGISRFFSATTFSIEAGTKKPDPALYSATAKRLGVPPARCLYVGDGGGNELTGATEAGMTAVLLDDPVGRTAIVYERDGWNGTRVGSLAEVLDLVL